MPALRTLGLDVNPSTEPLAYPGTRVRESCLIVGDWLYTMTATPGQPVNEWTMTFDDGPIGNPHDPAKIPLSAALAAAGVEHMTDRQPVLAVGSNASPGQLRHKFPDPLQQRPIPITVATVRGIAVGHSAHVSKPGYIPYAPLADAGSTSRDLAVLWLDAEQLDRIDETERTYERVLVRGERYPALLGSGQPLQTYALYRSNWGLLRLTPSTPPLTASTQHEAYSALAQQLPWFRELVPEHIEQGAEGAAVAFQQDTSRRQRFRQELDQRDLAASAGIHDG